MLNSDSNGNKVYKRVKREGELWGSNVWFGSGLYACTNLKRYYYRTKREALKANIADDENVLKTGQYSAI